MRALLDVNVLPDCAARRRTCAAQSGHGVAGTGNSIWLGVLPHHAEWSRADYVATGVSGQPFSGFDC